MRLTLSTSVLCLLVATAVCSVVLLLRPEPVELVLPVLVAKSPSTEPRIATSAKVRQEDRPWGRPLLPEPAASAVSAPAGQTPSGLPPLPLQSTESNTGPIPPLPPLPAAMAQPDVVYLGRMVKDGKVQVFFASNGEPVVLSTGDILNGTWRIQAISTTDVTLHHLQTGETRLIATGGSAAPRPSGIAPAQVGQRFLASQPIQQPLE
jgi:hypothetical protein